MACGRALTCWQALLAYQVAIKHHPGDLWPDSGSPENPTWPWKHLIFSKLRATRTLAGRLPLSQAMTKRGVAMMTNSGKSVRRALVYGTLSLFVASMMAFAQDPAQDPEQDPPPTPPPATSTPGWHRFSSPPQVAPQGPPPQVDPAPVAPPPQITIPAGAFVTVRVDQFLSSDKNKPGDEYSATLSRPIVADGLVVSRRGATLGGHVVEAKKAGRVKGVSQLQITLNSLTLADGQQVPVQTELTSITGPTSKERDAAAIVGTTVTGAAIGAAAAWGPGAAIGGGAGLLASAVGVLVTRGHPTVIFPESQLTFRLAKPVTFSTDRAPQAFAPVTAPAAPPQRAAVQGPPPPNYQGCNGGPCGGYPPPPPYYYAPYYPYPAYWGPSFGLFYGGGFGRGFYGRAYGFRR